MKKLFILTLIIFVFVSAKDSEFNSPIKNLTMLTVDTSLYANLQITTILTDKGVTGKYYDATISATFFDGPTSTTVSVSDVKYNGHSLFFNSKLGGNYFDTSGTQPVIGNIWEVSGLGNIPSFSFQPNNPAPKFTDFNGIPDTINSAYDITFPLTSLNNATHFSVILNDGASNIVSETINLLSPSQSRLTSNASLTPSSLNIQSVDLSSLSITNTGNLVLIASNIDYQVISGKKIAFTHAFFYLKNNFVIQ